MQKRNFSTELAYALGLVGLSGGTALMEAADFGVGMVVAPAYLVYLKLSESLPFVTFGMAEYTLQACLLAALCLLLRRFRFSYLFSFVTAVLYGFLLDGFMALLALLPQGVLALRVVLYALGVLACSAGVSLMFHTYISAEVYELFVKELSRRYRWNIHRAKTCYDCISCFAGILLSFAFFGFGVFEGVRFGTVLCALVNGFLIGRFTRLFDAHWRFFDALPLRKYFEDGPSGPSEADAPEMGGGDGAETETSR